MRSLLIMLILVHFKTFGQDYVVNWATVKKEPGIINYQIQTSLNNITFTTLPNATISPKKRNDTNRYSVIIPAANYWVRIKTLFSSAEPIYTGSIRIVNTNVAISNAVYRNNPSADNLTFKAENEGQVDYYCIYRTNNNGATWSLCGKLMQQNKKNYVVNVTKVGANRKYRLQATYRNGIVSSFINFSQ